MATTVKTLTISLVQNEDGTYAFDLSPVQTNQVEDFIPGPGHYSYFPIHIGEYLADAVCAELDIELEP